MSDRVLIRLIYKEINVKLIMFGIFSILSLILTSTALAVEPETSMNILNKVYTMTVSGEKGGKFHVIQQEPNSSGVCSRHDIRHPEYNALGCPGDQYTVTCNVHTSDAKEKAFLGVALTSHFVESPFPKAIYNNVPFIFKHLTMKKFQGVFDDIKMKVPLFDKGSGVMICAINYIVQSHHR